jgi:hypothetical protein
MRERLILGALMRVVGSERGKQEIFIEVMSNRISEILAGRNISNAEWISKSLNRCAVCQSDKYEIMFHWFLGRILHSWSPYILIGSAQEIGESSN